MISSKWTWIVAGTLVVILVVVIGVNWAIGQYLSAEGISRQIGSAVNRDVRVESVDFSVWTGITLRSIEVSEHPDWEAGTMVKAESLALEPRWWPLLSGNVVINDVSIRRPELSVRRTGEGVLNLTEGFGETGEDTPADSTGDTSASDGVALEIQTINLRDGLVRVRGVSGIDNDFQFRGITVSDFELNRGGEVDVDAFEVPGGELSGGLSLRQQPRAVRLSDVTYDLTRPGELGLQAPALPDRLTVNSGNIQPSGEQVRVSELEGQLGSSRFRVSGGLALPYGQGSSVSVDLEFNDLNTETILALVPGDVLPEGVGIRGLVSSPGIKVRGTVSNPEVSGTVDLADVNVTTPYFRDTLKIVEETLRLEKTSVRLDGFETRLGDHRASVSGTLRYWPTVEPDINVTFPETSVQAVLSSLTHPPAVPSDWNPEGTFRGTLSITKPGPSIRVSGDVTVPAISSGPIRGTDGSVSLLFEGETVRLDPLTMDMLGGRLNGSATLNSLFDRPAFRTKNALRSVRLEQLLTTFAGRGEGSRGTITTESQLNGTVDGMTAMDGRITTAGDSLVVKDVPAVNNLGDVIIDGISNALGSQLGPLVSQLFDQSLSEQKQELRRVFSEDVTSEFDRLRGDIGFKEGKGTIKQGELRNKYIAIQATGNLWLTGELETKVELVPRQKLIEKTRQDWLVKLLKAGLPPVKIRGTVGNPQYDMKSFQKEVVKTLARTALQDDKNDGSKEESTEDKLKREVIEGLFD